MDRWWTSETVMTHITDWSFELAEKYPDETLVSLGQSPSWFIFGAGMLRKMRGEQANTCLLPFTRAFFDVDRERQAQEPGNVSFTINETLYPSVARLNRYFHFISRLGMQPEQMMEGIENGQKYVIADMIKSAKGLGSFVHSWMRETPDGFEDTIGNEIQFLTYDTSRVSVRTGMNVPLMHADDEIYVARPEDVETREIYIPFTARSLNDQEADIMENTAACNVADPKSSRLMPMYQMAANKPCLGLEVCPNGPIRQEIKAELHRRIQERQQAEKVYPSQGVPESIPALEGA